MVEDSQAKRWIEAARDGDQTALSALLAMYHPVLRARVDSRMDRAIRAKVEPEDILQQAYIQVARNIGRFEDHGTNAFLGWVSTIVDNKLVDVRRSLHRKVRDIAREQPAEVAGNTGSFIDLVHHLYAHTGTPSRVIRRDEAVEALQVSVTRLSESQQQVIHLRFIEGRSVAEAAAEMGRTEAAIVALTKRALEALRVRMDSMGEFTQIL